MVKSAVISLSNEIKNIKKGLPIKSDEESSLVDKRFEISNLDLAMDLKIVVDFLIAD